MWMCAAPVFSRHDVSPAGTSPSARALNLSACARGPLCPPAQSLPLLGRAPVASGRAAARSPDRLLVSQLWDLALRHGILDLFHSFRLSTRRFHFTALSFLTLVLIRFDN